MTDLIDRQAAIDELESYGEFIAINIIKELPSAQPEPSQIARDIATSMENEQDMRVILAQPHWIPVSERLPEKGRYLVSIHQSVFSPQILNYDGEWYYDGCKSMDFTMPNVIAWCELPEPYKEA